jgi:hypothetical protein
MSTTDPAIADFITRVLPWPGDGAPGYVNLHWRTSNPHAAEYCQSGIICVDHVHLYAFERARNRWLRKKYGMTGGRKPRSDGNHGKETEWHTSQARHQVSKVPPVRSLSSDQPGADLFHTSTVAATNRPQPPHLNDDDKFYSPSAKMDEQRTPPASAGPIG